MRFLLASSLLLALAAATVTIEDPSDTINSAQWAADNAVLADYKDVKPILYQIIPTVGKYVYKGKQTSVSHETLSVDANDTSVVVITDKADVSIDYTNIVKFGYASNLLQSSFFGINAAVNVANGSIARLSNVNITTHNGAANLYSFGTGSVAYVDNAWLYSSGPVSHGLYAGGNGTVYGSNVEVYSGGNRCSGFSGDNPAGYIHINNAVVHTDGIGSAVCYALGLCNMTNVIGHASRSPVMFSDGAQTGIWKDCDVTAGLLGGIVMFSSMVKTVGASVTLDHSKLTTLGKTMPALWFGNVIAEAHILSSQINTTSGILVVANYSQITQDFDYYGSYLDNPKLLPADVSVSVEESILKGDLVAYNGSTISISLSQYASWAGKAYSGFGHVQFGVALDKTSNWTLTGDVTLQNFTDADATLSNIKSGGFNIKYNSTAPANKALCGKTIALSGGGKAMPI